MVNNPYQTYRQQSVMTMTPGDMLTALYDGLVKQFTLAQRAFAAKNLTEINRTLQKAQLIIRHLRESLDFQYEISSSLDSLYDYFLNVAIQANVKKDPQGLDDVIQMVIELRDTYVQADKKTRASEFAG